MMYLSAKMHLNPSDTKLTAGVLPLKINSHPKDESLSKIVKNIWFTKLGLFLESSYPQQEFIFKVGYCQINRPIVIFEST